MGRCSSASAWAVSREPLRSTDLLHCRDASPRQSSTRYPTHCVSFESNGCDRQESTRGRSAYPPSISSEIPASRLAASVGSPRSRSPRTTARASTRPHRPRAADKTNGEQALHPGQARSWLHCRVSVTAMFTAPDPFRIPVIVFPSTVPARFASGAPCVDRVSENAGGLKFPATVSATASPDPTNDPFPVTCAELAA